MSDRFPSLLAEVSNPLLAAEQRIVSSLSDYDKARIQALRSENLTKERHRILGIRSEDLFYFLQCVQQGYIPVAVHEIRGKTGSSHLYLAPNPDSQWLHAQDPAMFNPGASFQKMMRANIGTYAKIAKIQAVYRNVIDRIPDRQTFQRDVRRYFYENYGGLYYSSLEEVSNEIAGEDYYGDLIDSFIDPVAAKIRETLETQTILYRAFPELTRSLKKPFQALLQTLPQRAGICVAFSEDIARHYVEDRTAEDADDLVYHIPNGRLPIDYIIGFEPLGEYEDEVLSDLGIE